MLIILLPLFALSLSFIIGVTRSAADRDQGWVYYAKSAGHDSNGFLLSQIWRARPEGDGAELVLPAQPDGYGGVGWEHRRFDVSDDGRFIVRNIFSLGASSKIPAAHLVVYDLVEGTSRVLTNETWQDLDPEISHDGTRVAFIRKDGKKDFGTRVALIELNGGPIKLLRSLGYDEYGMRSPSWSPDGKRLVFSDGRTYIYDLPSNKRRLLFKVEDGRRSPYAPYCNTASWTSAGIFIWCEFFYSRQNGGTYRGRPKSGLYKLTRPVKYKGKLISRVGVTRDVDLLPNGGGLITARAHRVEKIAIQTGKVTTLPFPKLVDLPRAAASGPAVIPTSFVAK